MSKKAAMTSLAQGLQPQVRCQPAQLTLHNAIEGAIHRVALCTLLRVGGP